MKQRNYNTFTGEWEEYKKPNYKKYGKSETDKSKYRPNVSSLNDVIGATSTQININNYEFKDGKDTGERNYIMRSRAADITEKQAYLKDILTKGKMEREAIKEELQKIANDEAKANTELKNQINNTNTTPNNTN